MLVTKHAKYTKVELFGRAAGGPIEASMSKAQTELRCILSGTACLRAYPHRQGNQYPSEPQIETMSDAYHASTQGLICINLFS